MKNKRFKVRLISTALSALLVGNAGAAMQTEGFAEDAIEDTSFEPVLDGNIQTTIFFGEDAPEASYEEPSAPAQEVSEPAAEPAQEVAVPAEESTNEEWISLPEHYEEDGPAEMPEKKIIPAKEIEPEPTPEPVIPYIPEEEKIVIVVDKVDEEGNVVIGATLQILDVNGNVVDEWVSNGTKHIAMLKEGTYTLHEKEAPKGYTVAEDQTFKVKIKVDEVLADTDHDNSPEVCWHNKGVSLYYIESEGQKEEVYCINQDLREPNGIIYDGVIFNDENIREYIPLADQSMLDIELYNKLLDIIYHRTLVTDLFPEVSETAIRLMTEYALKTYTSAEIVTRQVKYDEYGNVLRDYNGNVIYEDIKFFKYFRYDANSEKGYVIDPGNGNGLGLLAEHWYNQHGMKLPEEYALLFNYLISDLDKHPEDMYLYIYSAKDVNEDADEYQNLLGIYSDEYRTSFTVVDEKEQKGIISSSELRDAIANGNSAQNETIIERETSEKDGMTFEEKLIAAVAGLGVASVGTLLIATKKGKKKTKKLNK